MPSTRRRPSAPSTRPRGVRVDVVVDGHGLDEARLPREDDEVEDGAGEVEPPADEPVDDRGLDLVRAVLGRRREAGEGAYYLSNESMQGEKSTYLWEYGG